MLAVICVCVLGEQTPQCWCVEAPGDGRKKHREEILIPFFTEYRVNVPLNPIFYCSFQEQTAAPSFVFSLIRTGLSFAGQSSTIFPYTWVNYFSVLREAEATEAPAVFTSESAALCGRSG